LELDSVESQLDGPFTENGLLKGKRFFHVGETEQPIFRIEDGTDFILVLPLRAVAKVNDDETSS